MSAAYYIAEGEKVTGPFLEEQLLNMWRFGQITANAQVQMEGSDEWVPIRAEISTIEAFAAARQMHHAIGMSAAEAVLLTEIKAQRHKSEGVAVLLGLLLPCAGYIYAGQIGTGIIGMIIIASLTVSPAFVIGAVLWLLTAIHSASVVRRYNKRI